MLQKEIIIFLCEKRPVINAFLFCLFICLALIEKSCFIQEAVR